MDSTDSIWYAILAFLLILSAFFSASEAAFATVNKHRLGKRAEDGDRGASAALKIAGKNDRILFAVLVGDTLVNILFTAIATVLGFARHGLRGAAAAAGIVAVVLLVFGEILPKTYAGDNSERVAVLLARPLTVAVALLAPFTILFAGLRALLYTLLPQPKKGPRVTEEELIYMIGSIEEEGVIEEQERELVQSALQLDEIAIHEILTPRVNIVAIDIESSPEEILATVVEEGYSRIPVFEENIDSIVGVLYSREYLNAVVSGKSPKLCDLMSKPLFVHKRMDLGELLSLFKARKANLAVVTDDYGGTLGIVTMEDVLEELVGDIWDEDDEIPVGLVRLDERTVEVAGDHSLEDTLAALGFDGDEVESDYTTVNGWALHLFEHIPTAGESRAEGELVLVVLEMDGHRIKRLRIARRPQVTA